MNLFEEIGTRILFCMKNKSKKLNNTTKQNTNYKLKDIIKYEKPEKLEKYDEQLNNIYR